MEGDNVDMGSSGGTLASSRWNPTKKQINMLESLYGQGIRTPNAEQIQQITGRLRAFGHIEGKNVFYWFQNHKARQRQRQKQERMAFINRYLHKAQPMFTPCTNAVCGPYYLPRNDLGFHPQCSKVLIPGGSKRRARTDETEKIVSYVGSGYDPQQQEYNVMMRTSNVFIDNHHGKSKQETLPLFPVHPTGILKGGTSTMPSHASITEDNSITPNFSSAVNTEIENASGDQPFFDFFSRSGCEGADH